eukprot:648316-Prymnesium_polylepis.1
MQVGRAKPDRDDESMGRGLCKSRETPHRRLDQPVLCCEPRTCTFSNGRVVRRRAHTGGCVRQARSATSLGSVRDERGRPLLLEAVVKLWTSNL